MLRELVTIVTPDTFLRGHGELIARIYDSRNNRRRGWSPIADEIRRLVVRMAMDNEGWAYARIVGELSKLKHRISRTSVCRILNDHGNAPAPERLKSRPWSKFLKTYWDGLAATDFVAVEVWTEVGLVRHMLFFVIELKTRRMDIGRVTPVRNTRGMDQMARIVVNGVAGCLNGKTHLIHDRDPLFTAKFRDILKRAGVETPRLPARSPNLNAFAERFVSSINSECIDRMVFIGKRHLRRAIEEYVEHYRLERPHQGLGNALIHWIPESPIGAVQRRERLGPMLSSYYREAA